MNLGQCAFAKRTQFAEGMHQQGGGRAGRAHVAGLDRKRGLEGNIDQPPVLAGKVGEARLQRLRPIVNQSLPGTAKCCDRIGNGVIETTVERAELIDRNRHIAFDCQLGNSLADIAIVVTLRQRT